MISIVQLIKHNATPKSVHQSKLKKAGCQLGKRNLPNPNVIIDLDKINNTGDEKCADFLFASDQCGGWIVALEMKKGSPDVSKCVKQLQGAAKIAESWISHGDIKNFYRKFANCSGLFPQFCCFLMSGILNEGAILYDFLVHF